MFGLGEPWSARWFLLLVACGAIHLALGDRHEALMLLGFVLVVIAITYVQKRRSEQSLEALRDLSSPRALVIRDGQSIRISGRELVVGGIVLLAEGDRAPADLGLLQTSNLSIDESLLTSPGSRRSAIVDAGQRHLAGTEHQHGDWELIDDYPLSPKLLAMSRVWQSRDRQDRLVASKGAPEAIMDLCHLDAA